MSDENYVMSLIYRDGARPAEIQLLLAYLSEILKEMQFAESEEENESCPLCESVNDAPSGE